MNKAKDFAYQYYKKRAQAEYERRAKLPPYTPFMKPGSFKPPMGGPVVYLECTYTNEETNLVLVPVSQFFLDYSIFFKDLWSIFGELHKDLVLPCPWPGKEIVFTDQVVQYVLYVASLCNITDFTGFTYEDWFKLIHDYRGRFSSPQLIEQKVFIRLIQCRKIFDFFGMDCAMAFIDVLYTVQYNEKAKCLSKNRLCLPFDFLEPFFSFDSDRHLAQR